MKNWQIIFWLVVFFPVGLYLMFRYSDWQKPLKYGLTGFYILSLFLLGAETWAYLFFLGSIFAVIVGLFAVFRKPSRSKGLMSLAIGPCLSVVMSSFCACGRLTRKAQSNE